MAPADLHIHDNLPCLCVNVILSLCEYIILVYRTVSKRKKKKRLKVVEKGDPTAAVGGSAEYH